MFGSQASASTGQSSSGSSLNSQNLPILQASANPNAAAVADSQATPPIDGGNALSSDMAAANEAANAEPLNTQISIYVVRQGDTVSSVAKMFNVSVSTVLWANSMNSRSVLQSGQTLVILPVTGLMYTVKKGDTIQSIAKAYKADSNDILNYNDLSLSSGLQVGDQILIPDAEIPLPSVVTYSRLTKAPYEPLLDGWNWPAYPGYYVCPVPGARISQGLHGHNAIDLAIAKGTPIRAAAAGTIIINRTNGAWNGGYGNFVVILHGNGTQTLYAHMSRSAVYAGQQVSQGQTIGYIGMTGMTTGPHVHLEVRGAQNPFIDPAI